MQVYLFTASFFLIFFSASTYLQGLEHFVGIPGKKYSCKIRKILFPKYIHTHQIHIQVYLFTTKRWSFPSPCGRTCAFCRCSSKYREGIRPHTSAYVRIRQHTSAYVAFCRYSWKYIEKKILWSFLSPPVAGLVHFVGIAGKATASYAFTTEETGVQALLRLY
jgi:hypothetical protein